MEHTFSITAAMLAFAAIAVIGLFAATGFYENREEVLAAENSVSEESPKAPKMLLGVFEGRLALYVGESPYPNKIYDFLTRTLPSEDQNRLAKGIEVSSEEELQSLLEDFMS